MPPMSPFSKSCIALAVAQSLSISGARAASIEVTSNLDDGTDCTLREALATTNAGMDQSNGCVIDTSQNALGVNDTINFAPSVAGQTITLTQGQLSIERSVSINPGGGTTTIDAAGNSRVIEVINDAGTVQLDYLVITGGSTNDFGGGILAITGGVSVSITNSTISGNSANGFGGGVNVRSGATVSLSNSTVSGNYAAVGGGIESTNSDVSLSNSTVSGNSANGFGGGIISTNSDVSLSNSTVSGNSAISGGGIRLYGGSLSLINSIVANSADSPSADSSECGFFSNPIVAIRTSIVDDTSCGASATVANPLLGPLADNGGPTLTHALLPGSPAIDSATGVGATTTDQRGFRAFDTRDIGAFEYRGVPFLDITVTSTADDNGAGCTLREAIDTVNALRDLDNECYNTTVSGDQDTIHFDSTVAGQTITLTQGQLSIESSVSINPGGISTTIDADNASRVIEVINDAGTVQLDYLVITGGSINGFGGGILAITGGVSVSITNSTISGNSARFGGGVDVRSGATVSISNSTISGNSANYGGGIDSADSDVSLSNSTISGNSANASGGGILSNNSDVGLSNSTVSGNSALLGGGVVVRNGATVSLSNSTISGNLAVDGGGIYSTYSDVSLSNSTVSGNYAAFSGGIYSYNSDVSLSNSTVSGNYAAFGGGIYSWGGSLSLINSIVANSADSSSADSSECVFFNNPTVAIRTSIVDDTSCGASATVANPLLGPLADNGGSTLTHALLPGSPAIDSANVASATTTDQRGFSASGVRDIGAFEVQPPLSLVLSPATITESGGSSTGTVSRTAPFDQLLNVDITSSDTATAGVEQRVEIPAGAASASFAITVLDDLLIDGDSSSIITVSSIAYPPGSTTLIVLDDDDDDSDSVADNLDNCPATPNPDQADLEGDGLGDACDQDIDGDGMPNSYELANGLNPRNSFDRDADPDGDGFSNLEEFQFRTDPQVPDQDENGNGIPDAIENKPINLTPILFLLLND